LGTRRKKGKVTRTGKMGNGGGGGRGVPYIKVEKRKRLRACDRLAVARSRPASVAMSRPGLTERQKRWTRKCLRGIASCTQRRTLVLARLLHSCTALSSRLGKASSSRARDWLGRVWIVGWLQSPASARPENNETNRHPSLAPTGHCCPLQSARHGKVRSCS
jgi:hypothetical protein